MADIIQQASAVLNALNAQATGASPIAVVDTKSFMALAQTVLASGMDMVTGKIDNLLSKTLFATRPYSRKLVSMHRTNEEYGIYTRRLHVADEATENSEVYADTSAAGVDQYRAKTPRVATTYIQGGGVHARHLKLYDHQFNTAFSSPGELMQFFTMLQQNFTDQIEQTHEQESRATLATFIAGKMDIGGTHVVYLLDEYNAETGLTLDAITVMHPDNFGNFVRWMYARINILSNLLTERSELYHVMPGIPTKRHTPKSNQHLYIHNEFATAIGARVFGDVYHPTALQIPTAEVVNFWQGITEPRRLRMTARYIDNAGVEQIGNDIDTNNVIGLLADRDCMGLTTIDNKIVTTPENARGRYRVMWAHFTDRTYLDYNAQGIVLALTR